MGGFSLTVIVPNYNNEKYLRACFNSILGQTFTPIEIIVVDDCSTDGSRNIIREYEKQFKCFKGIYLSENKGVSNARNTGLLEAIGEYVTFIDSDDYYFSKDKLHNEMLIIENNIKKGKNVMAYSATVRVEENGTVIKLPNLMKIRFINGEALYSLIARYKISTIPRDYCIKKETIQNVGGYSFYKNFYEDLDLMIRLAMEVPFCCTFDYGTAYRDTEAGLSKRSVDDHILAVNEIISSYYVKLNILQKIFVKSARIKFYLKKIIKYVLAK
jgi:glycosyltransferase involved in cell wall biosynthesis